MFRCPQNGILVSAESSQTFQVKNFSLPQPQITQGGGTPLFGLYGDVPLDRVWVFGLAVLNRLSNLTCLCYKRVKLRAERLNPDCEESLSFLSLRPGALEKLKEHPIERRTSDAFLFWICIMSTE